MNCMKKLYIFLLAGLVSTGAWAEDDTFYFNDAILMPGTSANIEFCMRNAATDLTCLEAEIQLPEGLSVALGEDGNPIVTPYGSRSAKHEILANVLDNGNLKLLISSIEANLFNEGEGPLLSFRVQADEDILSGEGSAYDDVLELLHVVQQAVELDVYLVGSTLQASPSCGRCEVADRLRCLH